MPRGTGTFTRINGQFTGAEVWQDDLKIDEKIVALRHDTHDEDLAKGIAQCLPKSGAEPMLGTFDMGGFNINGLANAFEDDQAAAFGQTITTATFDEPTRTLTLARDGMTSLAVVIQSGGDNTTVLDGLQRLRLGSDLAFSSGETEMSVANPMDTVFLKNSGVAAGDYTSANITVDVKGRITNATNGIPADYGTDLGLLNNDGSTLDVTSSTGANVTLPSSTDALAGLLTAAQYKQTQNLAVDGGGLTKPMTLTPSLIGNTVNDHTGTDFEIPVWGDVIGEAFAGLFVGEITDTAPTVIGAEPTGYMWLVYDA